VVATVIAGLRTSDNFATDERPKNFREFILFRNPNGSAPITALMAKARSESVDDPEFSWWDEPNDILRLQVNGAVAASGTLMTDSYEDKDGNKRKKTFVTIENVEFVPADKTDRQQATAPEAEAPAVTDADFEIVEDGDVPF